MGVFVAQHVGGDRQCNNDVVQPPIMRSRRGAFLFVVALIALVAESIHAGQRSSGSRLAGFEGIWNSATATPLERPRELKDKPFFTPEEAAAWEREVAKSNEEPPPGAATRSTGTGTYNTF